MHNSLIEYTIKLPQGAQENSRFKPLNVAGKKVFEFIEARLSAPLKKTAAYCAFEKSWVEFVNNSHDAGATRFSVRVFVLENDDSIKIQILDNGDGLAPEKETERYDWKKALLAVSDKAAAAKAAGKKSCGQHLALSTTAYLLERRRGSLGISNRLNKKGTLVTIVSPITPCNAETFLEAELGKGKNILEEMWHIISEDPNGIQDIERISSSPDITGSRKKAALSVLTRLTSPIDESSSAIETPTLATPLTMASSPQFLLRRSAANISFFSPSAPQFSSPDGDVINNNKSSTGAAAAAS